ncbi:uncharacterized protein LOC131737377 [Acipenser ruthenus]|uniref:uncharacterized protein LOC131737377 n=1 Tax=Acipenser ruthenus TaxID=7906 RepID=UPI002741ED4B|nr:uncharacterized protein LOC131737377 [Acipenser ruthenus]
MAVMHALVKWESGVNKDSYSVIPTAWIRNFDLFSIADDVEETTRSFRAEWRDTNKPPKGGWPVHEAQIIMTGKEGEIRRKLNDLTKMPSPKKRVPKPNKKLQISDDSDLDEPQLPHKIRKKTDGASRIRSHNILQTFQESSEVELQQKVKQFEKENTRLKNENQDLRNRMVDEIPDILENLKKIVTKATFINDEAKRVSPSNGSDSPTPNCSDSDKEAPKQVEIFPGTGVYID